MRDGGNDGDFREDGAAPILSMEMAAFGHSAMHEPQSIQVASSISATWLMVMASTGHI
jgi:hypothetical protein